MSKPYISCNGHRVSSGSFEFSIGRWGGEITVDTDKDLQGAITIDLDGVELKAFVHRGGVFAGQYKAMVFGGSGGLSKDVKPKYFTNVPVRVILQQTLREIGETLSPTSDAAVLDTFFARFHRPKGDGVHFMYTLIEHLDGVVWRTLDDGSVWVGKETWPEATTKVNALVVDDTAGGMIVMNVADFKLRAGITLNGKRLNEVKYLFDESQVRAQVQYGLSGRESFRASVRRSIGDLDVFAHYRAKVIAQSDDMHYLEVKPDSPLLSDITRVPIRTGLPGVKVKVRQGAHVMIAFENADRSQPVATLWESDTLEELHVNATGKVVLNSPDVRIGDENGAPIAREGDLVQVSFLPLIVNTFLLKTEPRPDEGLMHVATGTIISGSSVSASA